MTTVKSKSSVRRVLVIALAIPGCKEKKPEPVAVAAAVDAMPRPVAPLDAIDTIDAMPVDAGMPSREGPVTPEMLVRDARGFVALDKPDVVLVNMKASYVRSDGTLDPTYGTVDLEFGVSSRPLEQIDDPSRPTGAPLPPPPPETKTRERDCPKHAWTTAGWKLKDGFCRKREPLFGPRCTAKMIWDRAIANNAPKDALAVLAVDAPRDHASSASWHFTISDRIRKVSFSRFYADDCPVVIEKGSASE
jgi:hypothetical protein